jgi:DNA-binding winged helix-turn-helix (wHTH) protein/TolB-like protein/Tfp pilus assembly protein PilF
LPFMSSLVRQLYAFGPFRLDPANRLLLRDGKPVSMAAKTYETLLVLIRNQGKVLSKDELLEAIWPDTVVEEANLAVNISSLRKALGESPSEHKYIVTIPGRGYQFVAQVLEWGEDEPLVVERYTITEAVIEEQELSDDEIAPRPSNVSVAGRSWPVSPRLTLWGAVGIVVLGVILSSRVVLNWRHSSTPATGIRSVAVLPFKQLNAGQLKAGDDNSLGLGLADALITRLSNTGPLTVRPTSAIVKFALSEKGSREIGQELGVEALLEGRVQRDGDQLRLTVQLIRADNGVPLWAGSFDEQFTHVFAVQTAISERVAQALTLKLTSEQQQRLTKNYTANAAAFQSYIQGQYFWNKRTPESIRQAISHFERAIADDPAYALAYSGIADCHLVFATSVLLMTGNAQGEELQKAKAAALKALELDDTLAEAHTSLAAVLAAEGNPASHREYERATELNPNYAPAYNFHALSLIGEGRFDEALTKIKRALEIDPNSVAINTNFGMALYRLRRYDEALRQLKRSMDLNAGFARAHYGTGLVYEQLGRYDEAIQMLERAVALSQESAVSLAALGHAYALSGRRPQAERILTRLLGMSERGQVSPYYVAMVYAGLGRKDQALGWLEKLGPKDTLGLLAKDQAFDSLRGSSRFIELIQRSSQ